MTLPPFCLWSTYMSFKFKIEGQKYTQLNSPGQSVIPRTIDLSSQIGSVLQSGLISCQNHRKSFTVKQILPLSGTKTSIFFFFLHGIPRGILTGGSPLFQQSGSWRDPHKCPYSVSVECLLLPHGCWNDNSPHRLLCLNTWSPVGGKVAKKLVPRVGISVTSLTMLLFAGTWKTWCVEST